MPNKAVNTQGAFNDIKSKVAERLVELGWRSQIGAGSWVASKAYLTAVGEKDASIHACLSDGKLALTANYRSEGRNALSTVMIVVELIDHGDQLKYAVEQFSREIDRFVANTYAYRLNHLENIKQQDDSMDQKF